MSEPMTIQAMAAEARLEAVNYRQWAENKRRANADRRSGMAWPQHDIDHKEARSLMFERMAVALDFIAKHEADFREFIARKARAAG